MSALLVPSRSSGEDPFDTPFPAPGGCDQLQRVPSTSDGAEHETGKREGEAGDKWGQASTVLHRMVLDSATGPVEAQQAPEGALLRPVLPAQRNDSRSWSLGGCHQVAVWHLHTHVVPGAVWAR